MSANALLILTRPIDASEKLVAALQKAGVTNPILIASGFEFEPIYAQIPPFDEAIFTSQAAVDFAPFGNGRFAWCVGDRTCDAATAKGYLAQTAEGDVEDLLKLILKGKPKGKLLHIRGEVSRGHIKDRLKAAAFPCSETIVYRKRGLSAPADLQSRIDGSEQVFVFLFSAETVTFLEQWNINWGRSTLISISSNVAQAASCLGAMETLVAERPNQAKMIAAVQRLIA